MLQARFRQTYIARPPQCSHSHALRDGAFYARTGLIGFPELLALLPLPCLLQRFMLRLSAEPERAGATGRMRATRPHRTG
jgi:hypothetical protein